MSLHSFTVISLCRYVGSCTVAGGENHGATYGGADGVKAIDINFR